MAKPNYQFEKRQRDLAKKQKQEEKRLQKLANKTAGGHAGATTPDGEAPGSETPGAGGAPLPGA